MFGLERLPEILPVFPLTGALLLPKGHMPLNIFESRYLDLIYYAREKNGLIGMIQPVISPVDPVTGNDQFGTAPRNRPLYNTGCVGMISDLVESRGGGLTVMLTGLSRYDVVEELPRTQTFREVQVRYDRFQADCANPLRSDDIDRQKLVLTVEKYLKLYNVVPTWEVLERACDEELVNGLTMICPFDPVEKQALLEVISLEDRVDMMLKMMEFYLSSGQVVPTAKTLQ